MLGTFLLLGHIYSYNFNLIRGSRPFLLFNLQGRTLEISESPIPLSTSHVAPFLL
jgi:hypothetical protein